MQITPRALTTCLTIAAYSVQLEMHLEDMEFSHGNLEQTEQRKVTVTRTRISRWFEEASL